MIEMTERDFVDFAVMLMSEKKGVTLDFFLDLVKEPISVEFLDAQWKNNFHDPEYTGQQMLDLEALLYERGMLK